MDVTGTSSWLVLTASPVSLLASLCPRMKSGPSQDLQKLAQLCDLFPSLTPQEERGMEIDVDSNMSRINLVFPASNLLFHHPSQLRDHTTISPAAQTEIQTVFSSSPSPCMLHAQSARSVGSAYQTASNALPTSSFPMRHFIFGAPRLHPTACLMGEIKTQKLFPEGRWNLCALNTLPGPQTLCPDTPQHAFSAEAQRDARAGVSPRGTIFYPPPPPAQGRAPGRAVTKPCSSPASP